MAYEFVAGDTGSKLRVTCQNSDGTVIDLTGATVVLKWHDIAGLLVTRTMTIVNAVAGIVEYQFLASELIAKTMDFEVEITDSGGNVLRSLKPLYEPVRSAHA